MRTSDYKFKSLSQHVAFLVFCIAVLIGTLLVIESLWGAIFMGFVVAFIFQPVYYAIEKRSRFGAKINVGIATIVLILMVMIPLGILFYALYNQLGSFSGALDNYLNSREFGTAINQLNTYLAEFNSDVTVEEIKAAFANITREFLGFSVSTVAAIVPSLFNFAMGVLVFILVFIALLPNMKTLRDMAVKLSPLDPELTNMYLVRTGAMTKDVVLGTFLVGFCYMIAIGGMLYVVGFPLWALGGFAAFFLSFLPIFGPAIITISVAILLGLQGDWATGIAMILFHLLVLNNLDYILRPLIVSEEAKINSTIMIIALIGGLAAFGFSGVFYGPLIMVLFVATISVFREVYGANELSAPVPFDPVASKKKKKIHHHIGDRLKRKKKK